jgi:DnaJ-class molecular chaperone
MDNIKCEKCKGSGLVKKSKIERCKNCKSNNIYGCINCVAGYNISSKYGLYEECDKCFIK